MCDVEVSLVPLFGEVISVIDKALASPDSHNVADLEILRAIVLNVFQVKAGVVGKDWGLGKLLASEEHGEGVLTVVGSNNFLNLNSIVGKEVVATVELVTTIVAVVLPHNGEGENLAVIVQERLKVLVGTTTLKHHFDVVLVLSKIWGVLLHVNHSTGVHKRIIGEALGTTKGDALVRVKRAGEFISVNNSENTAVEVNISSDLKVAPRVRLN